MTWQIVAAVLGAWCVAIGAAAQEQPATAARGGAVARASLVGQLLRSPRWLLGVLVTGIGMILHLTALATAPLSVIQPLGISGLLVAVWVAARWRGHRVGRREILGSIAVSAGLLGLVSSLPQDATAAPHLPDSDLLVLTTIGVPLAVLTLMLGGRLTSRWRAGVLAAVAAVCFGVTAALVRVIAIEVQGDWSALWHWRTAVALVLVSAGGLILQNAYRANHFGLSYALLLVVDPVVAAGIGLVFLHEPLPATAAAAATACLSIAVTGAGVLALAGSATAPIRATPGEVRRTGHSTAPRSPDPTRSHSTPHQKPQDQKLPYQKPQNQKPLRTKEIHHVR